MNTSPTPTTAPLTTSAATLLPCPPPNQPNHEQSSATKNPKSEFLNPKYPTHLLPTPLRALTQTLAAGCHLPEAHVATTGLALLSAAIGSTAVLSHGFRVIRPNLFFLLLADDSANAAAAFRFAAAPLFASHHDFEQTMLTETEPRERVELTDLRQQRRKLLAEEYPDHRQRPRDLTAIEKQIASTQTFLNRDYLDVVTHIPRGRLLPRLLAQPHGLALLDSDARHAATSALCAAPGSLAAQDEFALLAGHRGTPILTDRKIKNLHHTPAPCLSVLWSLRPTDWTQLAENPRTLTSPVLPRFLLLDSAASAPLVATSGSSWSNSPHLTELSSSPTAPLNVQCSPLDVECWPRALTSLLEWKIGEDPLPFTLAPEAATLLESFESECLTWPDAGAPGTSHHFADHAYRLTLLLQLADHAGYCADPDSPEAKPWTEIIPATAAARAIALLRWYHQHQQPILETLHQQPDPDLKKITQWLTRAGGQLTLNHLRQHHNFTERRIASLVESYPHLLRLDDDPKTTPGRKSQFLTLLSTSPHSPHSPQSPKREGATWSNGGNPAPAGATPPSLDPDQSPNSPSSSEATTSSPKKSPSPQSPLSPQPPESPRAQVGAAFLPSTSDHETSFPNPPPASSPHSPKS